MRWFTCPCLTPDDAELLGIRVHEPEGEIVHVPGDPPTMEIGDIVIDDSDRVHVLPRRGLTDRQAGMLLGAAERAVLDGPDPLAGWILNGGGRWTTAVRVSWTGRRPSDRDRGRHPAGHWSGVRKWQHRHVR